MHFRHDQSVFEIIERGAEIRHWHIFEFGCRGGGTSRVLESVRVSLEEFVVDVDEVPHTDWAFFQLRGKIECAHSNVLIFRKIDLKVRGGGKQTYPDSKLFHRRDIPKSLKQYLGGSYGDLVSALASVNFYSYN